jgi:adenylate kinase
MDKAEMVDDSQVLSLLLRALLKCDPNVGVVVDGFPRTEIQAEFLKFLYDRLHELRTEFFSTQYRDRFRFANQTGAMSDLQAADFSHHSALCG